MYEVRGWFGRQYCLHTDDERLRALAEQRRELSIVARYFRNERAARPFAWDIAGPREILDPLIAEADGRK